MSTQKEEEIFKAIENGTFKFAAQQCSKLIKKYPKATYYQVLNNYILLKSGKQEESLTNCLSLMEKTPNDIDSLKLLHEIFSELGKFNESFQIFENAAKKYPSFEILTTWFHLGCEKNNVKVLQKASMALKSFHSKQRLFQLWSAFTSYLLSKSPDASVMERNIIPKVGLKTMQALKPLKSEQEVYILVKLLQVTGDVKSIPDEILTFTGTDKLDLELQIILMDTFSQLEDYENLYKWSLVILKDYKLDDFNTWKYLIKSSVKLGKDIEEFLFGYNTRNSRLAVIEYNLAKGLSVNESAYDYLKFMGTKPCAFLDIKAYIESIDKASFSEWLVGNELDLFKDTDDHKKLIWEVNVTKFKLLLNRQSFGTTDFISGLLTKFEKYKSLYHAKAKTDFHPGDEFILLLVQSLLSRDFSTRTIVICILILEEVLKKDEMEFHLRIWLVQLYKLINCHSQASLNFAKLKVKNVQYDIMSHYLVSRLATLNPDGSELEDHFSIYKSNDLESVYFIKVAFNQGSFNKIESMLQFHKRLDHSFLKHHELLQVNKISRLLNDRDLLVSYKDHQLTSAAALQSEFDNRDMDIFWDIGLHEPLPELTDKIFANIPAKNSDYNKIIDALEKVVSGKSQTISENLDLSCLSLAERWSFDLISAVNKLFRDQGECDLTEIQKLYAQFNSTKPETNLSWESTHRLLNGIDTAKSIQHLITLNSKASKGSKSYSNNIDELKEFNLSLLNSIREVEVPNLKDCQAKELKQIQHDLLFNEQQQISEIFDSLNIDTLKINTIIDIIKYSTNEQHKLIRLL
ncbi:hypothetical protein WICPIJ_005462 [Wickerhamomyces pijperi]|uniref:N-terminal acetyltransferase B complex subunit MDM20 n=1 Tax=Wickerhamomyces pijperi TaxID=599730 RepID=A0A9P8TLT7_WICPI|nr:hypothetical protein WICPIJ_005462 [Wickerhamomyces pijperi]